MKQILTGIIALSLLSVVFFGFFVMTQDLHDMARCFAAALQGRDCPESVGFLAMGAFHLDVLKIFSLATLIFLALLFLSAFSFPFSIFKRTEFLAQRRIFAAVSLRPAVKEMRWLERTFHSPTSFGGR